MLAALESCSFDDVLHSSRISSFNQSQNDLCRRRLRAIPKIAFSLICRTLTF